MHRFDPSRYLRLLAAAAFAVGVAACGHDNVPTTPSSSAARTASMPTPGAATGVTISGTVVGVASSSLLKTERVPLTVSVTGTAIASSVDDSGHFLLTNVPAGRIDLHFTGTGVDAHLMLDGVAEHATLNITVRVSGNDAHLEDDHGPGNGNQGEAEVSGTIAAGSLAGSCAAHNLSFLVGSTRVTTNASTKFRDGTCDSLKSGSRVEVKGTRQSDNSIVAASVESDDEQENNDDRGAVELSGMIVAGSLGGSCSTNSLSFKVGATLVRTNASTKFKDVSCSSLKVGDAVEVKGARQTDGSVLASRVEGNS